MRALLNADDDHFRNASAGVFLETTLSLLVNTWNYNGKSQALIEKARRVGLEISTVLTIISYGDKPIDGVNLIALLELQDIVTHLVDTRNLPPGQAQAVQDWLRGRSNHHPG